MAQQLLRRREAMRSGGRFGHPDGPAVQRDFDLVVPLVLVLLLVLSFFASFLCLFLGASEPPLAPAVSIRSSTPGLRLIPTRPERYRSAPSGR